MSEELIYSLSELKPSTTYGSYELIYYCFDTAVTVHLGATSFSVFIYSNFMMSKKILQCGTINEILDYYSWEEYQRLKK
jgi:hypothetical protein